MKYIVLDDEIIAANYLAELIKENDKNAQVTVLNNPVKAIKISMEERFDVFFIDIQMPGLNGIEFAEKLKKVYPKTNFIFVTGYSDYMGNAFELDASSYIMKPASSEQVKHAIDNLRYTSDIGISKVYEPKIKIICFGNFDILIDDEPIKFKFDKTKELMAFLVHKKGARCSNKEVMATLWEEDGHDSYYRMLKKDLQDSLLNLKCEKIIHNERGSIGLTHIECIECDYFTWLKNHDEGRKLYHGEYMAQYSWAEEINALIVFEKYSSL